MSFLSAARGKRSVGPAAVYGLVKDLRRAGRDERPLVVAGGRELAAALREELARGGSMAAIREGGTFEQAAALVYVVSEPASETDERELAAARRAGVPTVCVVSGSAPGRRLSGVDAEDVVYATADPASLVEDIAVVLARKLGEDATALAARLPALRRPVCAELIRKFSRQNGVLGAAVFFPGADLPALTLNQVRLVFRIAAAYGFELDRQRAVELLAVLGSGLGLRAVSRQLLGAVPVAGWAVKGAIAYAGTRALGEAAVRYFEARSGAPTPGGAVKRVGRGV